MYCSYLAHEANANAKNNINLFQYASERSVNSVKPNVTLVKGQMSRNFLDPVVIPSLTSESKVFTMHPCLTAVVTNYSVSVSVVHYVRLYSQHDGVLTLQEKTANSSNLDSDYSGGPCISHLSLQ